MSKPTTLTPHGYLAAIGASQLGDLKYDTEKSAYIYYCADCATELPEIASEINQHLFSQARWLRMTVIDQLPHQRYKISRRKTVPVGTFDPILKIPVEVTNSKISFVDKRTFYWIFKSYFCAGLHIDNWQRGLVAIHRQLTAQDMTKPTVRSESKSHSGVTTVTTTMKWDPDVYRAVLEFCEEQLVELDRIRDKKG